LGADVGFLLGFVNKFCIKLNELLDVQIQIYSAVADGNLILVEGCLIILLNLITEFFPLSL